MEVAKQKFLTYTHAFVFFHFLCVHQKRQVRSSHHYFLYNILDLIDRFVRYLCRQCFFRIGRSHVLRRGAILRTCTTKGDIMRRDAMQGLHHIVNWP